MKGFSVISWIFKSLRIFISSQKYHEFKKFLYKPNHFVWNAHFYAQFDGYAPGPCRPSYRFLRYFWHFPLKIKGEK